MPDNGFIKLHRELLSKPIWKQSTPEQKTILVTILSMVNHEKEEWEWKGNRYMCNPGQRITSLEKIAKAAGRGISIQNVRCALLKFERLEFLTNESTKTGRLITVLNWRKYQSDEKSKQRSKQTANKEPTPNKNDKNDMIRYDLLSSEAKRTISLYSENFGQTNIGHIQNMIPFYGEKLMFDAVNKTIGKKVSDPVKYINQICAQKCRYKKDYFLEDTT